MEKIRKSVIAGSWYPGEPSALRDDIARYIQNVPHQEMEGDIKALIVPHAGYMYSGQVAAYAYKLLLGKRYDSVILIGPSHRVAFGGVSIYSKGGYETPLLMKTLQSGSNRTVISLLTFQPPIPRNILWKFNCPFCSLSWGNFLLCRW
jgi:AmmeMemoRadiSam system protein B